MLSRIVSGDDNTEEAPLAGHFGPRIQTVEQLDWSKPQTLNYYTPKLLLPEKIHIRLSQEAIKINHENCAIKLYDNIVGSERFTFNNGPQGHVMTGLYTTLQD